MRGQEWEDHPLIFAAGGAYDSPLMFTQARQRRGPYALAMPSVLPRLLRSILLIGIVGFALFFLGRFILRLFGAGNEVQRSSVLLIVEARGPVNVSLEGGAVQRAEGTLKLYAGDRVSTGGSAHASLLFFDGSRARLDQQTDVEIVESARGSSESTLSLTVDRGSLFFQSQPLSVFSGSVLRTVVAGSLTLTIPTGAELVAAKGSLSVFVADGPGVEVAVRGQRSTIVIGEGQHFELPAHVPADSDLYAFRDALTAPQGGASFALESMTAIRRVRAPAETGTAQSDEILAVAEPENDAVITTGTVRVAGTMGQNVRQVRVNGYAAILDRIQGTFQQEIALRDEETIAITVEALDEQGIVLQEVQRTVRREIRAPESPAITFPAKNGETYRTSRLEFEIRGTATAETAGIIVNDYRLQLYKAGARTWGYLASTNLGNLVPGKNIFTVSAIDAAGTKSAPVAITILLEEGPEGVIAAANEGTATSSPTITPESLPNNPALKPGTLIVTGPTSGTVHTATGSELLIEGTTDATTASVWVNDYQLQLYKRGKTTWNYIAKTAYRNLKPGKNVYTIIARDAENMILDRIEYVVQY